MSDFLRHVAFDVPEPVRRFLQGDIGPWLRVEEFSDGSASVIRAELPGVDPEGHRHLRLRTHAHHLGSSGRRIGKPRQGQLPLRVPLRGIQPELSGSPQGLTRKRSRPPTRAGSWRSVYPLPGTSRRPAGRFGLTARTHSGRRQATVAKRSLGPRMPGAKTERRPGPIFPPGNKPPQQESPS